MKRPEFGRSKTDPLPNGTVLEDQREIDACKVQIEQTFQTKPCHTNTAVTDQRRRFPLCAEPRDAIGLHRPFRAPLFGKSRVHRVFFVRVVRLLSCRRAPK